MKKTLFDSCKLGDLDLKNRVVMAPMTRSRAIDNVPNAIMAKYYGQRASAGLIITEGTSPSPNGLGYARIPGLFNQAHVEGWRLTTNAVHKSGGKIFVQLMHTGRVSHAANMPKGAKAFAPSAIQLGGQMWTDAQGQQPHVVPTAMSEEEIKSTIAEYVNSAKLAIQAGFDGVEIHGANGYLIDQFLNTKSNQRTDRWGGSLENRLRFALEIAKGTVAAIGKGRTGMRVSPYGVFNDMQPDAQMDDLYKTLASEISKLGLAYIHIVDHSAQGAPEVKPALKSAIRDIFKGAYILSGGYESAAQAEADLNAGKGDLVAFGRPFIGNPNLVEMLRTGQTPKAFDPATLYTPGEKGYSDYL